MPKGDQFQIVSGRSQEFRDMGVDVLWESSLDRQLVTFQLVPVSLERQIEPRVIQVHITGDVEIHPGIWTFNGGLDLRQWASLLIWCLRTAYDKVYYIFNVDQLRFK
jgi:hypothetical protein